MQPQAAIIIAAFAISLSAATAATLATTPEQVAQTFCSASLSRDMAPIDPLLSPDLTATIAVATFRSAAIAQVQEDQPLLAHGLPWHSHGTPDGCSVGAVNFAPGTALARVEVRFSFAGNPAASYADTLILAPTEGSDHLWQIEDISMATGQTFTGTLASIFEP